MKAAKIIFFSLIFIGLISLLIVPTQYSVGSDYYAWLYFYVFLFISGSTVCRVDQNGVRECYSKFMYGGFVQMFVFFILSLVCVAIMIVGLIIKKRWLQRIGIFSSFAIVGSVVVANIFIPISYIFTGNLHDPFSYFSATFIPFVLVLAGFIGILNVHAKENKLIRGGSNGSDSNKEYKEKPIKEKKIREDVVNYNNPYDSDNDLL